MNQVHFCGALSDDANVIMAPGWSRHIPVHDQSPRPKLGFFKITSAFLSSRNQQTNFDEQVVMCCPSCYYHVSNQTGTTPPGFIITMCTCRIDYCNSLYAGCMQTVLQGLQRVQSTAAKLLTGSGRLESTLPLMQDLHCRVEYDRNCCCVC